MKQVKKDLQAVSNILKQLTKKTEKIANKLAKLEKAKAAKKPKTKVKRKVKTKATRKVKAKATRKVKAKVARKVRTKVARKARPKSRPKARAKTRAKSPRVSASGTVLGIIKRSRKGVDVITLRKKSGLAGRKINDIVHRLKKEGRIKAISRGVYVKA